MSHGRRRSPRRFFSNCLKYNAIMLPFAPSAEQLLSNLHHYPVRSVDHLVTHPFFHGLADLFLLKSLIPPLQKLCLNYLSSSFFCQTCNAFVNQTGFFQVCGFHFCRELCSRTFLEKQRLQSSTGSFFVAHHIFTTQEIRISLCLQRDLGEARHLAFIADIIAEDSQQYIVRIPLDIVLPKLAVGSRIVLTQKCHIVRGSPFGSPLISLSSGVFPCTFEVRFSSQTSISVDHRCVICA